MHLRKNLIWTSMSCATVTLRILFAMNVIKGKIYFLLLYITYQNRIILLVFWYRFTNAVFLCRFKTKGSMVRHQDTHKDTAYQCPQCPVILNSRRTLRNHMYVHETKARHVCPFCAKAFKRRKDVKVKSILFKYSSLILLLLSKKERL